jgi:hypothetical protein
MQQYHVTLTGLSPLLMHQDNLAYMEKIESWRRDPNNQSGEKSKKGDDRNPAWIWIGYLYHNGKIIGIPADNLMTMLREGGTKVLTGGKKNETFKKYTQSGIVIDQQQWDITVNGESISMNEIKSLIGSNDFSAHIETAEQLGFELLVKRAKIGTSKHVRVRPLFREWTANGSLTVLDPERSGITRGVLGTILDQAGSLCGLCDWRPSSPRSGGSFGKFSAVIE